MYQKNNCDGLANIATSQSWQNEGILTDILSFEPSNLAFTPTTLATMEQTLESFENEVVSESGDYNSDDYDDDDDLSNMSWEPAAKRAKTSSTGSAVSSSTSTTTRRLPGPKSSVRTEDMTPEEQRRRQRRRERNKQAAARCRQRRVDITNQLLSETQQLEADAQKLEREIDNLRKQRDQLQFVLEAHKPSCRAADMVEVKPELAAAATLTSFQTMNAAGHSSAAASAVRPSTLQIAQKMAPTTTAYNNSLDLAAPLSFSYDLGPTGFTPVVSSSGMGVFLGTGTDFVSPTTLLLLSPSTLLAQ